MYNSDLLETNDLIVHVLFLSVVSCVEGKSCKIQQEIKQMIKK